MTTSFHIFFSLVPEELKALPRWVSWRIVVRDGEPTKVPVNPNTGRNASCNDPGTWGTFEQALAHFQRGVADGIGFQLGPPYSGVDLDDCRDVQTGEIATWAQEIIAGLNSYSELSPSVSGVHSLVKGTLPPGGRRKGHIEMYSGGRFFTITGNHLGGTPTSIEARQIELNTLHTKIFGTNGTARATTVPAGPVGNQLTDDEILNRAREAANGEKFSRLWEGDTSGYDSHSEADMGLCTILAFWTGRDGNRMDRLFRNSKLFREKWDERHSADGRTYGQITIEKAIQQCHDVWGQSSSANTANTSRPRIIYSDRQLHDVTREAVAVLQQSNTPPQWFVRGGQLVRIRKDENQRPLIGVVTEAELRMRLAEVSDGIRIRGIVPQNCFPSRDVVQNILALGEWPFPALEAIVEARVLRPDGTVLSLPGYDAETRLFHEPAHGLDVPEIPNEPTRLDVAASMDLLNEVIGDFPFTDEASKANALAAMLTPVVRPSIIGKIPLALIDAPQMGTGKGLLAEAIGLIGTGREAAMMSAPKDEDEWRKRITAILLSGASVAIIDNIEHPLDSSALASVLTAREWSDRILGLSKMVRLPVRVSWIATGNNLRVGGDIARRCYWTRLDAKTARPWKRTGFRHPELLQWVSENRGEILAALLTLARAWFAAGKPESDTPNVGSFELWARTIGGVLGFAAVPGFLRNLDTLYDSADEDSLQWEQFLDALLVAFNGEPFTVKKVVERLRSDAQLDESLPDEVAHDTDGNSSFQRRLGKALSKREGRRYGDRDLRLERAGLVNRAVKWSVERE